MAAGEAAVKTGPLAGLKIIEMAGLGPVPLAGLMLSEMGAEVLRIERSGSDQPLLPLSDEYNLDRHGRSILRVDLKQSQGIELVLGLVEKADLLVEGFRPGVMERLGLGPDAALARNKALIYGRMTGFGQDGPLAQHVGHDINYVALSGSLSMIGRQGQPPTPPLSLIGDFGGGGMVLALGIVSALFEKQRSGVGQVIDASMVEGAALLATPFFGFAQTGVWNGERGTNLVDSGAPYYDAYETADGKWLAVGALEPHFYADLVALLDLPDDLPDQNDRSQWPQMKKIFADAVRGRTLADWLNAAEGLTPCIAPVLDVDEAPAHPHNVARGTFVEVDGLVQPAPAPRFSRTAAAVDRRPPAPGEHTTEILTDWGIASGRVADWLRSGAVREAAAAT